MQILSVIALGIICAVMIMVLKSFNKEFAIVATLIAASMLLFYIISAAIPVFNEITGIMDKTGIQSEYIAVILKAIGICYLADLASDVCRDAGQTALSGKIELAAKIAVLVLSLPLISNLLEVITDILK